MNPKNLYDIYNEVNKCQPLGISLFRIRDVNTLDDYVTCKVNIWKWDYQNKPDSMWILLLQPPFNYYYQLDSFRPILNLRQPKYTLLSSKSEVQYFRSKGENFTLSLLQTRYKFI